jgi:hypothetical protein
MIIQMQEKITRIEVVVGEDVALLRRTRHTKVRLATGPVLAQPFVGSTIGKYHSSDPKRTDNKEKLCYIRQECDCRKVVYFQ